MSADGAARLVRERLAASPSRTFSIRFAEDTALAVVVARITAAVRSELELSHPGLPHHDASPRTSMRWDDRGTVERIETFPFGGSVIEGYRASYALVLADGTAISFACDDDSLPLGQLELELRQGTVHDLAIVEAALLVAR